MGTPDSARSSADTINADTLRAAAVAGVLACLRSEEDSRRAPAVGPSAGKGAGAWALHGRRSIMQMRALVQAGVLRRRASGALPHRLRQRR
jgi:hypothetical protein